MIVRLTGRTALPFQGRPPEPASVPLCLRAHARSSAIHRRRLSLPFDASGEKTPRSNIHGNLIKRNSVGASAGKAPSTTGAATPGSGPQPCRPRREGTRDRPRRGAHQSRRAVIEEAEILKAGLEYWRERILLWRSPRLDGEVALLTILRWRYDQASCPSPSSAGSASPLARGFCRRVVAPSEDAETMEPFS